MIINHNIAAMNAYRQLSLNESAQNSSMAKLSSGLRINSAADDAAGLSISQKMQGQINGLQQATRNAQDGTSLIQTADGALSTTSDILQRMRELATQAANDTNTTQDRQSIQDEMDQLTSQINNIGNTTQFNTKNLLDGSLSVTNQHSAFAQASNQLGTTTTIISSATSSQALSSPLAASIDIHNATNAQVAANSATAMDLSAGPTGAISDTTEIDSSHNELILNVNGTTYDLSGANALANTTSGTTTVQNVIDDLNTKLSAAGAGATAYVDNGKLAIKSNTQGSGGSVQIIGGGAATALFGSDWNTTAQTTAGLDDNTQFSVNVGGVTKNITLATGTQTLSSIASDIQTNLSSAVGGNGVGVTVQGNELKIVNNNTGSTGTFSSFSGAGAQALGFTTGTITNGQDANNQMSFVVDGHTANITLNAGTYNQSDLASVIQNNINTALGGSTSNVSVEVTSGGDLKVSSGLQGTTGSVTVNTTGQYQAGAAAIGFDGTDTVDAGSNGTTSDLQLQIGANNGQTMSINIDDMRAKALGISGNAGASQGTVAGAVFTSTNDVTNGTDNNAVESGLDVSSAANATAAIEVIDNAINQVSTERSKFGAYENRLSDTINNLNTENQNITSAESNITDVDMAQEMMNQTKASTLAQAAQAMLAQANQRPQQVLQLLR